MYLNLGKPSFDIWITFFGKHGEDKTVAILLSLNILKPDEKYELDILCWNMQRSFFTSFSFLNYS